MIAFLLNILVLGQSVQTQRILMWSAVMVGLLIVAWVGMAIARRKVQQSIMSSEAPSFSISSLRQMVEEGTLTEEEYQQAREAIIKRARAATEAAEAAQAEADLQASKLPRPQPPRPKSAAEAAGEDLGPELLPPRDPAAPPETGVDETDGDARKPPPQDSGDGHGN